MKRFESFADCTLPNCMAIAGVGAGTPRKEAGLLVIAPPMAISRMYATREPSSIPTGR